MIKSETFKKNLRYLIFAVVCGAAILPSLLMGYYQTLRFTEEKFELFGQHLESIARSAEKETITPEAVLEILHVHELVLWCRYLSKGIAIGEVGHFSNRNGQRTIIKKTISLDSSLKSQISDFRDIFKNENNIYVLEIPLHKSGKTDDVLEVGIWFEPLANLQKNGLALSLVLFLTAMVFLVAIYIFSDNYLTSIFEKVSKGLSTEEEKNSDVFERAEMPFFSPSIRSLITALKKHSTVLNDERTERATMATFIGELNRQLNEQRIKLEETHHQLMQTSKLAAIGELAGGVAHEVNNPNGVILAGAKYLQGKLKSENVVVPDYVERYLDRIIRQSTRISEIVSALLAFSRRKPKEKLPVITYDCAQDAFDLAIHRFKGIVCENRLSKTGPKVLGNKNELSQVFLNLFNNAADAMPQGGKIEVTDEVVQESGGISRLRIFVHNTGENIPTDILDKVMEPFFTTKALGQGTGLGLSVSLGIIENHGGKMSVKNHPNGGAVFEINLPIIAESQS